MAVKFSSRTLSKRINYWVSLKTRLSSSSCAVKIHRFSDNDEKPLDSADFEASIRFLKNTLHPDVLVSVLDRTPDLDSSIKIFKWASLQNKFKHTTETYHRIIQKLGMAGHADEVEGFCKEMVREKCPGLEKSFLSLVDSFVSNHRLTEALRILYVMNLTTFKPSIEVFNTLMGKLIEGKRDFKNVVFLYKEMVKAGVFPNIDTLNFMIEALFEAGKVDMAMGQYKRIHKKGCDPNSRTFEILISGLYDKDRVEECTAVLYDMFQLGCEPDSSFYCRVIPIYCKLQNLEIVMRLCKMMRASAIAPNSVAYEAAISCLCEHLSVDEAIELYEEMITAGFLPRCRVILDLVNGLCKLERFDEAKIFLKENNVTDASVYNMLLESCCHVDNFGMVKDLFDEMFERDTIDARSWNFIIRFICEKSVVNKALEYLCRMVISSFLPDSATYSALILGNCRMEKIDCALDLFSHVRSKLWVLDSVSYAELVDCLCEHKSTQEAIELFCYMSSQGFPLESTSFSTLVEKICANSEINKAIRLLSLSYYTKTVSTTATYNSILRGLYISGQQNSLLMILSQMIVVGCVFNVETYCILIQSKVSQNRVDQCVSLFNLMLSKDLIPDQETFICLLSCLVEHSQVHLILSSIDKLISKFDIVGPVVHNMLINTLWKEGYKSEARGMLDVILEKGWVPHASTHELLMCSPVTKEMTNRKTAKEDIRLYDNVSSILAEGLGET